MAKLVRDEDNISFAKWKINKDLLESQIKFSDN